MIGLDEFPYCCTGKIVRGFGGSRHAEGGQRNYTEEEIRRHIEQVIEMTRERGYAFVSATTNSEQLRSNKVLRELGFRPSKWMSKRKHGATKVRLWYKALEDV